MHMKRNNFNITSLGIRLKVFRAGHSTQLIPRISQKTDNSVGVAHTHFTYEVFFVTNGSLRLISENGTTEYERSAVIVPPKLGYYSVPDREGSYCLLFSFDKKSSEYETILGSDIITVPLTDESVFYIKKAAQKLDCGSIGEERDAELLITLLFNELFRELFPDLYNKDALHSLQKHISAIEAYVNENIRSEITLADISKCVYLSQRQVSRIIAKEYGVSLPKLVSDKRLAAAEILLRTTDMSVSQVAERVGIVSVNYFYTLFKSKYGISPLQYRKRLT